MTQACEAIYENGVFRPVDPVGRELVDGQRVRLLVETHKPDEILDLATDVYANLSEDEVAEIEQIALDRSTFFSGPSQ
jgi:predicted DNA-binding antitoxin AbrB/MazE fold protein